MTSIRPLYTIAAILLTADDLNRLAAGICADNPPLLAQVRALRAALANLIAPVVDCP